MIGFFTAADLLKYAEFLLRESRLQELKTEEQSIYGWLKSKPDHHHHQPDDVDVYLEGFKPMILKMSPECCTAVAVKLDTLTEQSTSTEHILATLETLLYEQDSMHIMAWNVKSAKEKMRKVHPELEGRQATVSFIVQYNKV